MDIAKKNLSNVRLKKKKKKMMLLFLSFGTQSAIKNVPKQPGFQKKI